MLIGYFIGMLISISIFSLINAAILRFAVQIVIKKIPPFKTAFWISFGTYNVLVIGQTILKNLPSSNGSVLFRTDPDNSLDSPIVSLIFPVIGFVYSWLLISNNISDSEGKIIGNGKGISATAVQFSFLSLIVLLVAGVFPFLHR